MWHCIERRASIRMIDVSQDLIDALERADVYRYHNWKTNCIHCVSRNLEALLTDNEKKRIRFHLLLEGFPLEVIFDN